MHRRLRVVHLVDDTTAGGVMRVLDYIKTAPAMVDLANHAFETVQRGKMSARCYEADIIVSHLAISWRTLPALMALRLANRGKRLVHVEHSYTEGFVCHNVPNTARFHSLLRCGFAVFDAVVAVSHAQADWLRRTRICPERKLFTIRSCVDLSEFAEIAPVCRQPRVLGAVGRLDRQKGFDTLIKGFKRYQNPEAELHFYGTGDALPELQAIAEGDTRIQFKGFCSNPLTPYRNVDIVVVPSRWEAYGLVAIEALCAGRRVICADVDGLRDHQDYGAQLFGGQSGQEITAQIEKVFKGECDACTMSGNDISAHAQQAFAGGWKNLFEALTSSEPGHKQESGNIFDNLWVHRRRLGTCDRAHHTK